MIATKALSKRVQRLERRRPKLPVLVLFQTDWGNGDPDLFETAGDKTTYNRADFAELGKAHQLVVVQYEAAPIPDWSAAP